MCGESKCLVTKEAGLGFNPRDPNRIAQHLNHDSKL